MSKRRNRYKKIGNQWVDLTEDKGKDDLGSLVEGVDFELDMESSDFPPAPSNVIQIPADPHKGKKQGKNSTYTSYSSCHTDHKPLKLGTGQILGASCLQPRKGYDIYIGFDTGMERSPLPYPWEPKKKVKGPIEVYFPIVDMGVPKNPEQFKAMVTWVEGQLNNGKRVHVGCIGGHGRTGLFLSALVKQMLGHEDAITWVRDNYCKKAVESDSQIKFLGAHYKVKSVSGSKEYGGNFSGAWSSGYTASNQAKYTPVASEEKNIWAF